MSEIYISFAVLTRNKRKTSKAPPSTKSHSAKRTTQKKNLDSPTVGRTYDAFMRNSARHAQFLPFARASPEIGRKAKLIMRHINFGPSIPSGPFKITRRGNRPSHAHTHTFNIKNISFD